MNDMNGLESLLTSLGMEILTARAGSTEGQFPILDLLTNLQEVASHAPVKKKIRIISEKGRERMVAIVKGAKPFTGPDILWMRKLLAELQVSAGLVATDQSHYAPEEDVPEVAADEPPEIDPLDESDAPMLLNLAGDLDLLLDFSTEIREHLDNIEAGVLTLETKPDDRETLDTVFRAFHTTKGSAGFLNLTPINRLSHVLESLLELVRQHKLPINKQVIDLILRGRDTLKMFQNEIGERLAGKMLDKPINILTLELRKDVQAMIDTVQPGATQAGDPRRMQPSQEEIAGAELGSSQSDGSKAVSISLPTESAASADPDSHSPSPDEPTGAANRVEHNRVVKVDTRKLDALLDLRVHVGILLRHPLVVRRSRLRIGVLRILIHQLQRRAERALHHVHRLGPRPQPRCIDMRIARQVIRRLLHQRQQRLKLRVRRFQAGVRCRCGCGGPRSIGPRKSRLCCGVGMRPLRG